MPREKEFQRKKKDTRMPVRDSHAEERMDTRQSEQDFNLLRVRDAPSSLERPGAGGMKPQHSRQRMIHSLSKRMYRSRRIFPYRNIWKAGIWTMSRHGHLKHGTLWNRELLHRNRAGGISDMWIPGVRILTAAILI